ncbi:hypothetical protein Aph02nite_32720 [Actinoplanes philippinensis]|uniref:Response regulator receiver domain-containing protein n=1 Tax=Actinoplanes philippinensis TaxID=35752 RepID=A0A1I2E262_9ACTN|nr:response regulator [Actinoplanes philippinensis]GIE77322.1 hypothetical protein Aph02nite_32720 [Actinoplanes philippinensis]SFE86766.1 Response regulator receiver domain-containing protein [Actinoplanes philippinensis]
MTPAERSVPDVERLAGADGTSRREEPRTILVATRDDWTLAFLNCMLGVIGYHTRSAADRDSATESAAATPPDLIVLDQDLVRSNCLEFCRRIQGSRASRPVPIIILTDRTAEMDAELARVAGVAAWIAKPNYMPELADHLRTLLPRQVEKKSRAPWRLWGTT